MRIGIFFGGASREREVSFAGGRTVYDNLNKELFEAVPFFIDPFGTFIKTDWQFIYKGSIRDFYPPAAFLPDLPHGFQIYAESLNPDKDAQKAMANAIGTIVPAEEISQYIDFAFLALHGVYGEDGSIQGLMEWLQIPYSGSGIFASALGMNKARQKDFQERAGLYVNHYQIVRRNDWVNTDEDSKHRIFRFANVEFKEQFVVKPANQGSSLGVSVLKHPNYREFESAMDLAFFRKKVYADEWNNLSEDEKVSFIKQNCDIRSGLGLPVTANGTQIFLPHVLLDFLNSELQIQDEVFLEAPENEIEIVLEEFLEGREFSCIVLRDEKGNPVALPPTAIIKKTDLFDYRSKYLPGLSQKETPIQANDEIVMDIRDACVSLFEYFGFNTYARIDGFLVNESEIFLNDPNTTSGMMPSSFFFHQAAEVGLNPSQFLTFIIHQSLRERILTHTFSGKYHKILASLDENLSVDIAEKPQKKRIAVIMGGYSFERHISMESGRNIYEKLSSSSEFEPIPLFLTGSADNLQLYKLPVNFMLKDNADDIREKIEHYRENEMLNTCIEEAAEITAKYNPTGAIFKPERIPFSELPSICEGVFIALHGRPGEDGTLQKELVKLGLYYNGSEASSAGITINKYVTNEMLREAGFLVADHLMLEKDKWLANSAGMEQEIISRFGLPLIAKPADDGCSAAVRKVKSPAELHHFIEAIFRSENKPTATMQQNLGLLPNEEFPAKSELLIEKFIEKGAATRFLEVTGGMLCHRIADGSCEYEVFEPSESLAETEILSLEEKFLAGEGQNITPSRFSANPEEQKNISQQVKTTFEKVARTLNVTGYCRIDAFVRIFADGTVETIIIEINSLPGMTPATCIYHQAAINGYKPFDFISEILKFGKQSLSLHA
ncbi:MAG: D-alanine--D-alanine ligase [Bacteroidia bacterium]|nr:D-alanine--D-alanine ligase [Bacteroidia bacterium]